MLRYLLLRIPFFIIQKVTTQYDLQQPQDTCDAVDSMIMRFNDQIVNTCTQNKYCTEVNCVRYGFSIDDIPFSFIYYPCEESPGVWYRLASLHDGFILSGKTTSTQLGVVEVEVEQPSSTFQSSFDSAVTTALHITSGIKKYNILPKTLVPLQCPGNLKQSEDTCRALMAMNRGRNPFELRRCRINKLCTSISCIRSENNFDINLKYIVQPCGKPFGVSVVLSLQPIQYVTKTTNISSQFGQFSVDIEPSNQTGMNLGASYYTNVGGYVELLPVTYIPLQCLENIVVTPALEPTIVLPTDTSSALCKKNKLLLVIIIYSMLFFYYLITFVF